MTPQIFVSTIPCNSCRPDHDERGGARSSYVVAVSEDHRDAFRPRLARRFPHLVSTVVSNVFIVDSEMTAERFHATVETLAADGCDRVDVVFIEDMNWAEINRSLQQPTTRGSVSIQ